MRRIAIVLLAAAFAACASQRPIRRRTQMEALPPPEPEPHAQTSVSVGGSVTFEADHVVACRGDVPDLFRAYATESSLTLIGRQAGRGTLEIRIQTGDIFYLDVDVTSDEPARRALAVGDLFPIPLTDVKESSVSGNAVTTATSSDQSQLIVTAATPGIAIVLLQMNDGSSKPVDFVVVNGTRLF